MPRPLLGVRGPSVGNCFTTAGLPEYATKEPVRGIGVECNMMVLVGWTPTVNESSGTLTVEESR